VTAGSADDTVPGLIAGQLTALAQRIQRANLPGGLDGLSHSTSCATSLSRDLPGK
jgi:hypothetical protein